jgi:hypothetical protein
LSEKYASRPEAELWQELINRQEEYMRALEKLDAQVLGNIGSQSPLDLTVVEEAGEARRGARALYRRVLLEIVDSDSEDPN